MENKPDLVKIYEEKLSVHLFRKKYKKELAL